MNTSTMINLISAIAIVVVFIAYLIIESNRAKLIASGSLGESTVYMVEKLANMAAHELEDTDMDNADKKQAAVKFITDNATKFGINNLDTKMVSGAVEAAVGTMHLAYTGSNTIKQAANVISDMKSTPEAATDNLAKVQSVLSNATSVAAEATSFAKTLAPSEDSASSASATTTTTTSTDAPVISTTSTTTSASTEAPVKTTTSTTDK